MRRASALALAAVVGGIARPAILTAQPGAERAPLAVAWRDVPVAEALERLATTAPMNLVWDAATVRAARQPRVSCRFADASAEQVLGCVTREAGLDWYRLSSGTYVVIPKAEAAPGFAALAGVVVDAATGSPLPGARVWVADAATALAAPRASREDGSFAFPQLLPGPQDLVVQALGYRPQRQRLALERDGRARIRVALEPVADLALPIVVTGTTAGAASGALGGTTLEQEALATMVSSPALLLPGGAAPLGVSRRDGLGDLHLQGGDLGEHPWRLDGVPLFDAAALSGLLGVASPLALERITVRRAGFRASDGSFAAGAIDLTHALGDPRGRAPQALVTADPLALSARVTAPLVLPALGGARGQLMVAGREGLWDRTAPAALTGALRAWSTPDAVLLQRLSGFGALPGMADLEAATFAPGGRERVTQRDGHAAARLAWRDLQEVDASVFRTAHGVAWAGTAVDAQQRTLETRDAYAWRTTGGQAGWRRLLGTRVRQHLQVWGVSHALTHDAAMAMTSAASAPAMAGREGNTIRELGARAQWQASGATGWTMAGGLELAQVRARVDLANAVLRPLAAGATITRAAAWGDATWPLGGRHFLETGLRVTQLETGRTYAEPRLALRGEATLGAQPAAWRIAGGGYHQFVSQFDIAATAPMAVVPSVRFWLPMDGRSGVATAWHAAGEGTVRVGRDWALTAEAYGRWQPVIPTLDYGALFDMGAAAGTVVSMASFVRQARGMAAGAGVRATRDAALGPWPARLELAYDIGMARRTFPSRFGGTLQPVPWLEPRRAQVALDVQPARGVTAAVRARHVADRPWALRQAYYDLFGAAPMAAGLPVNDPGAMRRPALMDLDIGLTVERRIAGTAVQLGASVTNLLNRANVLDYGLQRTAAGDYRMVPRLLPGRMPAVTLRITP